MAVGALLGLGASALLAAASRISSRLARATSSAFHVLRSGPARRRTSSRISSGPRRLGAPRDPGDRPPRGAGLRLGLRHLLRQILDANRLQRRYSARLLLFRWEHRSLKGQRLHVGFPGPSGRRISQKNALGRRGLDPQQLDAAPTSLGVDFGSRPVGCRGLQACCK